LTTHQQAYVELGRGQHKKRGREKQHTTNISVWFLDCFFHVKGEMV